VSAGSAAFAATKFGREPERFCDEDCAEFLSGARFDIPSPPAPARAEAEQLRTMRDALQKAWIVLDALRGYRPDSELLGLINSEILADAREAVRLAGSMQIGSPR
jgi:hypothetical protein